MYPGPIGLIGLIGLIGQLPGSDCSQVRQTDRSPA